MLSLRPTRALCGWALRMAGRDRGGAGVAVPEPEVPVLELVWCPEAEVGGFWFRPQGHCQPGLPEGLKPTGRPWDLGTLGGHLPGGDPGGGK